MKRTDLMKLENDLIAEVGRRRPLGGYSTDAESIFMITMALLGVVSHILDTSPPPAEPAKKKVAKKKTK